MSVSSTTEIEGCIQHHNACIPGKEDETEESLIEKLTFHGIRAHKKHLIHFSLRILNIQNTHCSIKDKWCLEYIIETKPLFLRVLAELNVSRINQPIEFDCFDRNRIFQRQMRNHFEDYGVVSGTFANDIQHLLHWMIKMLRECEDGCKSQN